MGNAFDLDIVGLKQLQARLGPDLAVKALRGFAARAVRTGKRTATKAIDGGSGTATQSIVARFNAREGEIFVKSMMPLSRGLSIDEGRAPGDPPSLGHLINWKDAVGHPDSAREIRKEISARGVKGKRFLGKVVEQWEQSLGRWLEEAAQRIEKKFKTGV